MDEDCSNCLYDDPFFRCPDSGSGEGCGCWVYDGRDYTCTEEKTHKGEVN